MKNKYQEALRTLMKLFGEEIEPGVSYEHIHKVINDNLYNLKELNDQQKELEKQHKSVAKDESNMNVLL